MRIPELKRGGYLKASGWRAMEWSYTDTGRSAGSIGIRFEDDVLRLSYNLNGDPKEQRIHIDYTPCHFGGRRAWLLCPRCGKRQKALYLGGHPFACRVCNGLCYQTQQEDLMGRSWVKQRRVERRMGGANAYIKPRYMHETTWQKLRGQLQDCEHMRTVALYNFMQSQGWLPERV